MLMRPVELCKEITGSTRDRKTYSRRNVNNPELMIVQRKPDRTLKPGQKKHPEVERTNQAMVVGKERAKAIYRNPEECARYKEEYEALKLKDDKIPKVFWQWLYGKCIKEAASAASG